MAIADTVGGFFKRGYKDKEVNAFKKTNLRYTENDLLKFQDPTYLGFKLFFLFDQPESGLLSTIAHPNTALKYLLDRGYTQRAAYLKQFVTLLQRINKECPWFWQSIEGLDEAWKHGFNEEEFVALIGTDKKITINTLDESVDLRMTALMDLYRKACFDWTNRREVVPRNLRFFSVAIYCYESRSINRNIGLNLGSASLIDVANGADPLNSTTKEIVKMRKLLGSDETAFDPSQANVLSINDNISRIMFDFNYCEWLPDESGVVVGSLSNAELALKAQKLVFSYRTVAEDNIYRMHSDAKVTDVFVGALDALAKDDPIDILKDVALAKLKVEAKSKLNNLFLGNAYGFDPIGTTTAIIADPKQAVTGAVTVSGNSSLKNDTNDVTSGRMGNGYNPAAASLTNIQKGKASFPPNKNVIFENKSLTNAAIDSIKSIPDNPYPESKSLTNDSLDGTNPIDNYEGASKSLINKNVKPVGNYEDGSSSLANNKDKKPSGNYETGSKSLNNNTTDVVLPIDNYETGSKSLNNNTTDAPNPIDNYENGSKSLNNVNKKSSGNVYKQ